MTEKGNSKTAIYSSLCADKWQRAKLHICSFQLKSSGAWGDLRVRKNLTGSFLYLITFRSTNSNILQKYSLLSKRKKYIYIDDIALSFARYQFVCKLHTKKSFTVFLLASELIVSGIGRVV